MRLKQQVTWYLVMGAVAAATASASGQAPVINDLAPASPNATNSEQRMTIQGRNFSPRATVIWRDTDGDKFPASHDERKVVSIKSQNIITRTNFAGDSGQWAVRVRNPGDQASEWHAFTVGQAAGGNGGESSFDVATYRKNRLSQYEGVVPHVYDDAVGSAKWNAGDPAKGNLTVGIGHLMRRRDWKKGGQKHQQSIAEFNQVMRENGYNDVTYRRVMRGKSLTREQMNDLAKHDIRQALNLARRVTTPADGSRFFSSYPSYLQQALVDLAYRGDLESVVTTPMQKGDWDKAIRMIKTDRLYGQGGNKGVTQRMNRNINAIERYAQAAPTDQGGRNPGGGSSSGSGNNSDGGEAENRGNHGESANNERGSRSNPPVNNNRGGGGSMNQFNAGQYTDSQDGRYLAGGPATTGNGRTSWSLTLSGEGRFDRLDATWATGSVANHPHLRNYPATDTLPDGGYAFGHATTNTTTTREGRLIGARQTGKLISITFFELKAPEGKPEGGTWLVESVFVLRPSNKKPTGQ